MTRKNRWSSRPLPDGFIPAEPGATVGHVVDEHGCWLWTGSVSKDGYGVYTPKGASTANTAHGFYYRRENGEVADGLELDHTCRVRRCVRPAHLEPVTPTVNRRRSSVVKLTPEIAATIRAQYSAGAVRMIDLAHDFGVGLTTIHRVIHSTHWTQEENNACAF